MGGRIRNDASDQERDRRGHFMPRTSPLPADFEAVFIRIGRVACEEHYGEGRRRITHWLEECGKDRLIAERAEFVRQRDHEERQQRLSLTDMARILSRALPVEDTRIVSDELAAAAAHHLRIKCNGGFFVSPTGAGDWWVGLRRRSSADLVDMAKARGFKPASLTGGGSPGIGSGQ